MARKQPEATTPEAAQEPKDLPEIRIVEGVDGERSNNGVTFPKVHKLSRKKPGTEGPGWYVTRNGNIREDY